MEKNPDGKMHIIDPLGEIKQIGGAKKEEEPAGQKIGGRHPQKLPKERSPEM